MSARKRPAARRTLPSNVIRLDDARPRAAGPTQLTVASLRAMARAGVPVTQEAEVLGLMPDGRLVLWAEREVQPMSTFPRDGLSIEADRYVLDWKGHPVAAHCSGPAGGIISIWFLCGRMTEYLPRQAAEKLLLAQIGTREHKLALRAQMEALHQLLVERNNERYRQRGRI